MMILAAGFALLLAGAQGDVYVARGDTLVISGTAIRLKGVELPGGNDPASGRARQFVQEIVDARIVSCRLTGERMSNLMLGTCMAGGEDIAAALVRNGFALDCQRYSNGQYRALEPEGARERLGASVDCSE